MHKLMFRFNPAAFIFTGIFLLILTVGPAYAKKKYRITLVAGHPSTTQHVRVLTSFFKPELKKRAEAAGHQIEFVEGFGGSIAKVGEVLEAVQSGITDIGLIVSPFEPTKLYMHNFFYYTPFSTQDVQKATKVAQKLYDEVPYLKDMFEKKYNQKVLGVGCWSSYELVTKFPIKNIEDLKNHKIAGAGPNLSWISSVGAVPVQGSLTEGYTGLQMGIYDGWIITAGLASNFKFYELAKHFTLAGFGAYPGYLMTVNLDFLKSLPDNLQKMITDLGREYVEKLADYVEKDDVKAFEVMKAAGVTIYQLPESERHKWAEAMPDLPQKACDKAKEMKIPDPAGIVNAWVKLLEEDGYKWPRRWKAE